MENEGIWVSLYMHLLNLQMELKRLRWVEKVLETKRQIVGGWKPCDLKIWICVEMGELKDWVEIRLRFEGSNEFVERGGFVGVV